MTGISKYFFQFAIATSTPQLALYMPELPDLQAFSRNLSKKLVGKTIEKIHAIHSKKLKTPEKNLGRALEGSIITSIDREGKELHFRFHNGSVLSLHLMLKGQLHLFEGKNDHRFTIIEIVFTDGTGLAMTDQLRQAAPALNPGPKDAPDALSKAVNVKFLKQTLGASKAAVKKLLMDQNTIRGIGNAYADEILWDAGISPFSISNKIPAAAIRKLAASIKAVLRKAEKTILRQHGDTISGEHRDFLSIHNPNRTHSPTGAAIRVDESGSRKTYYTDEQERFS